ncbi:hypothetical protein HanIR_Chr04g0152301 [Helianthus annuus]|nr:hypothetical protein HanIR_Chr04g0152301 [Helianthus annuus]
MGVYFLIYFHQGSQINPWVQIITSLKDDIASTTSLVKVCPAPDDPINTVGLIDW